MNHESTSFELLLTLARSGDTLSKACPCSYHLPNTNKFTENTMKRASIVSTALVVVVLLAPAVDAQRQEPRRPGAPVLTNDDVLSPRAPHSLPDESIDRTNQSGSPLRNARTVLESALTKMIEVSSVRTRMQTSLPTGQREILIESMKPDRAHIISSDGEMIVIGRQFYLKSSEGWQVTSMPAGSAQSDAGFDFRTFVKQMIGKSSVRITGHLLGGQMIDGVDTVAYEFAVTDGSESGTIQVSVGKEDGYMRRMSLSEGAVGIKIWFTNINEQFSIEPPM